MYEDGHHETDFTLPPKPAGYDSLVRYPEVPDQVLKRLKNYPISEVDFVSYFTDTLDPVESVRRTLRTHEEDDEQLKEDLDAYDNEGNTAQIKKAFEALARRTMAKPGIIEYINEQLVQAIQAQSLTSARWVLEQARSVYEKCSQLAPIRNSQGRLIIGEFQPVPALRALDIIGKHVDVQAFKEVVELTTSDDLAEVLNQARRRVEARVLEGESETVVDEIEDQSHIDRRPVEPVNSTDDLEDLL